MLLYWLTLASPGSAVWHLAGPGAFSPALSRVQVHALARALGCLDPPSSTLLVGRLLH